MSRSIRINDREMMLTEEQLRQSLLQVLRDDLGLTGTKEGCASGDCGACTVVAAHPGSGLHTLNSCITPSGALVGGAVLTVEGVGGSTASHPVQRAMIETHAAQCGFCTPGFVMSIVGDQLARHEAPSRSEAELAISGNLCRCTGYRPLLDACQLAWDTYAEKANEDTRFDWLNEQPLTATAMSSETYLKPSSLAELQHGLAQLAATEGKSVMLAGATDAWLQVTQQYTDYACVLDLSALSELKGVTRDAAHWTIGGLTNHADLMQYFTQLEPMPSITGMLARFGSPQIRARGTIGGNLGNGSPIADWPPVLLVLDAQIELFDAEGHQRMLPVDGYYLDYRQTQRGEAEVITRIRCDAIAAQDLYVEKVSKRTEDDISSVLLACRLSADPQGVLHTVRVAFGGMAATPLRIKDIEQSLTGINLAQADEADLHGYVQKLRDTLRPLTDVRASAQYRMDMAVNLLLKTLLAKRASILGEALALELKDV